MHQFFTVPPVHNPFFLVNFLFFLKYDSQINTFIFVYRYHNLIFQSTLTLSYLWSQSFRYCWRLSSQYILSCILRFVYIVIVTTWGIPRNIADLSLDGFLKLSSGKNSSLQEIHKVKTYFDLKIAEFREIPEV